MTRRCTVCVHSKRADIDRALVNNESYRNIAQRFGVSTTALYRHKADHIPALLAKAKAAEEVAQADDLLAEMRRLQQITMGILGHVGTNKDYKTALVAVGQARANIEVIGKLLGQLDDRPVVNILVMPEWLAVRAVLLRALAPYPDARAAVAAALTEVEHSGHRA